MIYILFTKPCDIYGTIYIANYWNYLFLKYWWQLFAFLLKDSEEKGNIEVGDTVGPFHKLSQALGNALYRDQNTLFPEVI